MRSVERIVELTGGWDRLRDRPLRVEAPGFMPLHIEVVGRGPGGGLLLAISHSFVQNGDLMRDPEVVVEVTPGDAGWLPLSYQQDGLGILQEAVVEQEGGGYRFDHRLVADLRSFLRFWDKNLQDQGFVEAAERAGRTSPDG